MPPPELLRPLSAAAFATLMLIALMMGGNHVAARSMITALVVAVIVVSASLDPTFTVRQRWVLIARCVHGAADVLQRERLAAKSH